MALTTGAKVFLTAIVGGLGVDWWRRRAKAKDKKGRPPGPKLEADVLSVHVWEEMGEQPRIFELDVGKEYEIPLPFQLNQAQTLNSTFTSTDMDAAPANWGYEEVEGPEGPAFIGSVFMATHKPATLILTFTARTTEGATPDWQRQAMFKIG